MRRKAAIAKNVPISSSLAHDSHFVASSAVGWYNRRGRRHTTRDHTMSFDDPQTFLGRRELLKAGAAGLLGVGLSAAQPLSAGAGLTVGGELPREPLEIGGQPQFVFDLHTVD